MRTLAAAILFCLLVVDAASAQEPWKTEHPGVKIPMRDGKYLAADVYLPAREGKYPTVLVQTPYNRKNLGAPISGQKGLDSETGRGSVSDALGLLDREHYAYVVVDWRGFYGSRTAMDGASKRTWKRGQDGYDSVEWIAGQPWSDGKVGTWGGSALGKQQFDTAAERPPHLVCCVPLIAAMGQCYESYYEGGVLLEAHVERLEQLGYNVSAAVLKNPDGDTMVWKAAERLTYRPDRIGVPCLLITGWWDNYPDLVVRTFDDIVAKGGLEAQRHSRLLIGPWDHVSVGLAKQGDLAFPGAEKASATAAKAFFDRWLRGMENGWDDTPRVRYWAANGDRWEEAKSWKEISRRTVLLSLGSDGRIVSSDPATGPRSYSSDPRDPSPTLGGANLPPLPHGPTRQDALDSRKDLLAYTMDVRETPLPINGSVEFAFDFEADRSTCDFCARLCEVRSDGHSYLIADVARRARDLVPGKKSRITLRFPLTAYTIAKGSSLRLYLGSTNSPRYERNTNAGQDHWDEHRAVPVTVTVHHEKAELRVPTRGE
ncbi:MAG: CocE/NonD family hydrolase [Planctomycetes bacterium]|nr:CocE/NonD family hydrolase [Planctomycetota bacterium]